jgi:hypothetical protein
VQSVKEYILNLGAKWRGQIQAPAALSPEKNDGTMA